MMSTSEAAIEMIRGFQEGVVAVCHLGYRYSWNGIYFSTKREQTGEWKAVSSLPDSCRWSLDVPWPIMELDEEDA